MIECILNVFLFCLQVSVANHFSVNSSPMKELITDLNKYMSSPCDPQRIAAIGFYSQVSRMICLMILF